MYSVYKHINKENKKVYIGITSRQVEQRWANGHGYKNNLTFYKDILKYGWDNFTHEIICTCDTYEEAIKLEEQYIKENINNCYNVSKTACTVRMHKEPDTNVCTDNNAQKSFQWHNHMAQIPLVEKPKRRHSYPVSQYSMDGTLLNVFASAKEASIATNINNADITSCCKGRRGNGKKSHGAGGYIWRYNIDKLDEFPDHPTANKKVYQFDSDYNLIRSYDSAIQAALENSIPYNKMLYLCSGRSASQFALGYYWRYEE